MLLKIILLIFFIVYINLNNIKYLTYTILKNNVPTKITNNSVYDLTKKSNYLLEIHAIFIGSSIESTFFQYCLTNHKLTTKYHYNRYCDINKINQYTILKNLNIKQYYNKSKNLLAYNCLKQILKTNLILSNNKYIDINDCIICDFLSSKASKFSFFHTDLEYERFPSEAFNLWYLIKNDNNFGNMFLLETPEYKKEYTPCWLNNDDINNINVYKHTLLHTLLTYEEKIASFDINKMSIKYLNMANHECIVMSKHLLHRTDLRRDNAFDGFNFRVILKNKDGSVDYNGENSYIKKHHIYDEVNHKLYNVKMFDFI
jgi:hypothetical protein